MFFEARILMNKKLKPNSYAALDAENHFHPYSNARRIEEQGPMVISEGEGIYVWGDDGKKYLEAMAGLWSAGLHPPLSIFCFS